MYQKPGPITIAAEFSAHSVPVPQGVLSTEDYIVVEVGFFGNRPMRMPLSLPETFRFASTSVRPPYPPS